MLELIVQGYTLQADKTGAHSALLGITSSDGTSFSLDLEDVVVKSDLLTATTQVLLSTALVQVVLGFDSVEVNLSHIWLATKDMKFSITSDQYAEAKNFLRSFE